MAKKTKRTDDLEKELGEKSDLSAFLTENEQEFITPVIGDILSEMLKDKKMTKSELSRRSGMSEVYLYQILKGRRFPSRDRMLSLCLGLGCTEEETQELLRLSRYAPLYPRIKRDAAILFAIRNNWQIDRLNDALYDIEEETLI